MLRHPWKAISLLAATPLTLVAGVPPEPLARAQDTPEARAKLVELVESGGLTRGQLANLYASLSGADYQPKACVAGQERFADVPASSPFCPWIEELARRRITSGCTATQYCPNAAVTRAQMAVFVVKSMEACPTLAPNDKMIRVGGICIDKYEASLWDCPRCTNPSHLITGEIPCSPNGQDCDNIWARSVAGVQPRADITWFQAQAALANSGKRLPTNAEWQMAVRGTPDGPACNVESGGPVASGSFADCVSTFGAFDMVGNLWEWVADWGELAGGCFNWDDPDYGSDVSCMGRHGGDSVNRFPGALRRGANWDDGASAGPFAVHAFDRPLNSSGAVGFRGAR